MLILSLNELSNDCYMMPNNLFSLKYVENLTLKKMDRMNHV